MFVSLIMKCGPLNDPQFKHIGNKMSHLSTSLQGLLKLSPFQVEEDLLGKLWDIEPNPPEGPDSIENEGKGDDRS